MQQPHWIPCRREEEQEEGDNEAEQGAVMAEEDEGDELDPQTQAERREANVKALLSNNLQTTRAPILSKFLSILEGEKTLKRAFISPKPGAPAISDVSHV
jgi:hypothetical protein